MDIFFEREKAKARFKEVLADRRGQAIIIVGAEGSGKSSLLNSMVINAEKNENLHCDCNIYNGSEVKETATLLRSIGRWPAGVVTYNSPKMILERLSKSVEEFGDVHRRVIGIEAEVILPPNSVSVWHDIVKNVGDKVKFIFTQRPDDVLTKSESFMELPNVVRIDLKSQKTQVDRIKQAVETPDDPDEFKIIELRRIFEKYLQENKGYIPNNFETYDDGEEQAVTRIIDIKNNETLAVIMFGLNEDISTAKRAWGHFIKMEYVDIAGYLVLPGESSLGEEFNILKFSEHANKYSHISIDVFPAYEELKRKPIEKVAKKKAAKKVAKKKVRDEYSFRTAFKNFLEGKGYSDSLSEEAVFENEIIDIVVSHPEVDSPMAAFVVAPFGHIRLPDTAKSVHEILVKTLKVGFIGIYNPFVYIVKPSKDSKYVFEILEYDSDGEANRVLEEDFPTYNQMLFASPLSGAGRRLCRSLVELAKDKHGLSVHAPCQDYVVLQIKKNKRTAAQIHRLEGSNKNIALVLAGYKEVFPESKNPTFISKGKLKQLSGYLKKYPGEINWLEGNLGHQQLKYKAGVYILKMGAQGAPEVLEELDDFLESARKNAEKEEVEVEPEEMSASRCAVSDSEADDDKLGFEPYVEAVAEFLVHEDTQPPLTISVEGEWGSGKSSFMRQLKKEIKRLYTEQGKRKCFIVEFDPWRHDKDESLWAAFALKFIRDSASSLTKEEQWSVNWKLWKQRFQWKKAWPDLVRVILIGLVWILATVAIAIGLWKGIKLGTNGTIVFPKWLGSVIAVAVSGWGAFGKVKDFWGSPLAFDLKKYMNKLDYVSKISFIEKFHKDFEEIVKSYAGNECVYVFIDDLDRCKVPKAAELMESINLMISDNPKLVFIMGMDREKVAAGLAVKHEKLLPYLSSQVEIGSDLERNHERMRGIRYGYSFIEKFIQISFILPIPSRDAIENMLLGMAGEKEEDDVDIERKKELSLEPSEKIEDIPVVKPEMDVPSKEREEADRIERKEIRKEVMLKFKGDNKNFRSIVLMASEAFGDNPRRAKQFVNLFRLRIMTAASTGLITPEESQLTFVQLGKFVGIGLGWPLFIRDLERNYGLLNELVDVAEGENEPEKINDKIKEWKKDERLIGLIKSGCFDENGKKKTGGEYERFSIRRLDVEKLIKVAPRVKQMDE